MAGDNIPTMGPEGSSGESGLAVIVAARNEADRIAASIAALREAFPAAAIWVADDASGDGTAEAAMAAGAQVVSRGRPHGKGANVTAAAQAALGAEPAPSVVLLCDGDLGRSAGRLGLLVAAASATSRSPPSRAGSAAASGSRSASPASRCGGSAALRPRRRSPANGRCGSRRSAPACRLRAALGWRSG
jgi:glycosyltransferase involved in cell wall biosynthesis